VPIPSRHPRTHITYTFFKMPACSQRASKKYRANAANRQFESSFAFLQLPAEICNRIYKYTLTAAEGVRIQWQAGKTNTKKKPVMLVDGDGRSNTYLINQLQYVNHQLHKETAGLEIQYNRVIFSRRNPISREADAIRSALIFAGSCTLEKRLWLTNVILEGLCLTPERPTFECIKNRMLTCGIFKFCQEFPHARVDLRLPGFCFALRHNAGHVPEFMLKGAALVRVFRGTDMSYFLRERFTNSWYDDALIAESGTDCYAEIKKQAASATRLRIFPIDKRLQVETFKKEMNLWWRGLAAVHAFHTKGAPDMWASEAQRWFLDSIWKAVHHIGRVHGLRTQGRPTPRTCMIWLPHSRTLAQIDVDCHLFMGHHSIA
jgi:hypothetical protein